MFGRSTAALLTALSLGATVVACASEATTRPFSASDARFDVSTCAADVTPPVIQSVTASPNTLWPPNHKLVPVTVTTVATDNCTSAPACAISSISSNEPVNGKGDGNTAPDYFITGANTALLRAERAGPGSGRVYTVGVTCADAAGNRSTSYTTVTVPHDQGKGDVDKCSKGDKGAGDDKNGGDKDLQNKCKHKG